MVFSREREREKEIDRSIDRSFSFVGTLSSSRVICKFLDIVVSPGFCLFVLPLVGVSFLTITPVV